MRSQLERSNFDDDIGNEDFMAALLTFDDVIRKHMRFLNGVVHQAAPGDVHLALWELILEARSDSRSLYSCYSDFLVNA